MPAVHLVPPARVAWQPPRARRGPGAPARLGEEEPARVALFRAQAVALGSEAWGAAEARVARRVAAAGAAAARAPQCGVLDVARPRP